MRKVLNRNSKTQHIIHPFKKIILILLYTHLWSFHYDYAVVKPATDFIIILMALKQEPFKQLIKIPHNLK